MGTSHHEPMARNHQEWARKRKEYGAWDYASNQKVIDRFFREGIERAVDTEDLITIGMAGGMAIHLWVEKKERMINMYHVIKRICV